MVLQVCGLGNEMATRKEEQVEGAEAKTSRIDVAGRWAWA